MYTVLPLTAQHEEAAMAGEQAAHYKYEAEWTLAVWNSPMATIHTSRCRTVSTWPSRPVVLVRVR